MRRRGTVIATRHHRRSADVPTNIRRGVASSWSHRALRRRHRRARFSRRGRDTRAPILFVFSRTMTAGPRSATRRKVSRACCNRRPFLLANAGGRSTKAIEDDHIEFLGREGLPGGGVEQLGGVLPREMNVEGNVGLLANLRQAVVQEGARVVRIDEAGRGPGCSRCWRKMPPRPEVVRHDLDRHRFAAGTRGRNRG